MDPAQGPLSFGQAFLGSLLGPLATAAIVVVFVVCLLLEREDFRDRFLKLVSRGDLRTSTRVMTEAGRRVSRYLLVQLSVNVIYGTVFGLGLYFIGIPDALIWGLLTALFRYIPFVGTLIAACLPFALAVAIDPHWGMLIEVGVLFFGMELVVTNAIEPRLYGSSTGLSALAVIIAAMFWATLWGPVGLILSTPLTVCLVVLGRYVPQLQFLETMLGSEPVLVREEQLYQRLVSGNTEEAIDLAEEYVAKSGSPRAFYDEVAIPALRFAESDRNRDGADLPSRRLVAEGMDSVVRELESLWPEENREGQRPLSVLCIGGRTELDGAAASMVAQTIASDTILTQVLPPVSLRPQGIGQIDLKGIDLVCIAYLNANHMTYLRYAVRRLRRRSPHVLVVACLFDGSETADDGTMTEIGVSSVAFSVASAEAAVFTRAEKSDDPAKPDEEKNFSPVEHLRLLTRPGPTLNEFTAAVAAEFAVQIAVVLAADEAAPEGAAVGPNDLGSLRDLVMQNGDVLVITDTASNEDLTASAFLVENSFGFFAGVALHLNGEAVGALMVFDQTSRDFSDADQTRLREMASSFVATDLPELSFPEPQPSIAGAA